MKTNTELLMSALGWQGGTVHQVAQDTGLTVIEILELHTFHAISCEAYNNGLKAVRLKVVAISGGAYKDCKYRPENVSFWRGVLDAMRQKDL